VDGVLISDQDEKAGVVDTFYSQLLGSTSKWDFSLDLDYLGTVTRDLSSSEAPFLEEEVWGVVRSQESDKALGTADFSGWFYTSCWPSVKHDVMEAFRALWRGDCCGMHVAN
jgi:hypothetical protein